MLLHFIFVIKETDLEKRKKEFAYVKQMAQFYKLWIKNNFSKDVDIKYDEMISKSSLLERLDTNRLLQDHRQRGEDIYHFYLCHFRPFWTDCTCEGYHAENFGMIFWQTPKKQDDDVLFLAEKNCTVVSHEIAHELLRQTGNKNYVDIVHDVWTRHFYANLPFEQYGKNFEKTSNNPFFMTIDTSSFRL